MTTQQSNPVRSFDGAPPFNHPQLIRHLYENDFRIERDILREILALPRETLLDDLSAILNDAKNRYEFFVETSGDSFEEYLQADWLSFPLHALFLLQEIECRRSFDIAMDFLRSENSDFRKNGEFIDFWLRDYDVETAWLIFFHLGQGREQELADFLFERNVDTFTKIAMSTALQQMAFHFPERAEAVHKLYESVFECLLAAERYDEAVFNAPLVGMVVTDYVSTCPRPVSPLVRQLFADGWIETWFSGTYEEITDRYQDIQKDDVKAVWDIFELYDNVVETCPDYNPEQVVKATPKKETVVKEPSFGGVTSGGGPGPYGGAPKIGRNEPCPCGSGKKYKKCCLD